ncbi:hypothetical protein [Marinobacter sp. LN3S78]|uniref:hypothetical protein n=1 Tax=Marinobacter sp. LN3S78 TaxID=3382300 RepID=UPI00387A85D5
MANWLEELEQFGTGILGATQEGLAARIKQELGAAAPANAADRPETQYDTTVQEPLDGPEQSQGVNRALDDLWGRYKWWVVGGLGITAYLAFKGAR